LKSPEFQKRLGRECSLICEYEDEETQNNSTLTLIFDKVEAFKVTYYKACNLELIQNAYDKVISCGNTKWLQEVKNNLVTNGANTNDLLHLAVYFDEGPSYEFICGNFRIEKQ
jgi:hypothetical protein